MSRPAATVGSVLVIVGLMVPMVVASGPLGIESETIDVPPANDAVSERGTDGLVSGVDDRIEQPSFAIGADRFDRTLFEITVYENRSARWRFQFSQRLDNDTEVATFKAYAAEFRTNETDLYRQFVAGARELTRTGSNVTGREMNTTGFSRDAYTGTLDNLGIVEMSFIWTNFGQRRDNGGVVIGDVFEGGLAIQSNQRLRIAAGPSLTLDGDSVIPLPSNTSALELAGEDSVEWVGEYVFADQRPHVAFDPVAAETTTEPGAVTTSDGTGTSSTEPTTDERAETTPTPSKETAGGPETNTEETTVVGNAMDGFGLGWMLVGLGVIALVVVVGTWRLGYLDVGETKRSGDSDVDEGSDAGTGGDGGAVADASGSEVAEAALLSDDDRIRQLLEDNGGRMKQTAIVEATEWSKSKVSMLLSEMEDDGEITKLRVGRENIVSLPGSEPDAARSPFEDRDEE